MWITALAVQYRDVKHGLNFVVQLHDVRRPRRLPRERSSPPAGSSLYALNPMVGVIEGFRAALLGTATDALGLARHRQLSSA